MRDLNRLRDGFIDVPGWEGVYRIDAWGRLKSRARGAEVLRRPQLGNRGYLFYRLSDNRHGRVENAQVHRLVAQIFIPNPDGHAIVNHKDGDKLNNSLWNLEWCTYSDNIKHAYRIGLRKPSATGKWTKFSDAQIRAARAAAELGVDVMEIAKVLGTDNTYARRIIDFGTRRSA